MLNKKHVYALCVALSVLTGPGLTESALAEEHYRGNDIRRFHEHDMDLWKRGGWRHEYHEGRMGWWWVVGGIWYFYANPVYPYPDPYLPSEFVIESPPPVVEAEPVRQAYHYYCQKPRGYYPYVARCLVPWQRIVQEPVGMPPPADASPIPPLGLPPPGM